MDHLDPNELDVEAQMLSPETIKPKNWLLDDNDLEHRIPLDNGWHNTQPTTNLGSLDRLPLELLTNILLKVDLQALTDFRRVNQRAMETVDSISQYNVVIDHAPNSLRAILAVQKARQATCQDLYDKLCTSTCESCGHFGGLLYLITFRRTCVYCFENGPYCCPSPFDEAQRNFSLTRSQLLMCEPIISVPGCYSPTIQIKNTRDELYDFMSLSRLARRQYRPFAYHDEGIIKGIEDSWKHHIADYPKAAKPWDHVVPELTRCPLRYMATIRLPHYARSSKRSEWGFLCRKCMNESLKVVKSSQSSQWNVNVILDNWFRINRLHDKESFREHRETCYYQKSKKSDTTGAELRKNI